MKKFLFAAALMGSSLSLANATGVASGWEAIQMNQAQCLDAAVAGVNGLGFRENVSRQADSVYGWRGEEGIAVRCISDRQLAVIFSYLNELDAALRAVDAMRPYFQRGGGGAPPAAK